MSSRELSIKSIALFRFGTEIPLGGLNFDREIKIDDGCVVKAGEFGRYVG